MTFSCDNIFYIFTRALMFLVWPLCAAQDTYVVTGYLSGFYEAADSQRRQPSVWLQNCLQRGSANFSGYSAAFRLMDLPGRIPSVGALKHTSFGMCMYVHTPDVQPGIYLPSVTSTKNCTLAVVSPRLPLLMAASYNLYLRSYGNYKDCQLDHLSSHVWWNGPDKGDQ